ncbi:MAG TPA: bifunctional riboflavin kinase/FAD synthetase [Gemmatimonadaceae bacterium]|nr:bifunctional riboflavin kinase/FAD synthetase [Gemmatimonadaceae bacterium]
MELLDPHAPLLGSRGTAITVGTFDGVHCGHQDVLARLVARARATGLPALLVTFEPHPLEVVNPAAAPLLLTTREEKLAALAATGLDLVAILPFTRELAAQSADAFVDRVLLERFHMRELLIGHDHGFGKGREGDVETLRSLGASRGFGVEVVPPVLTEAGEPISSSRIRRAVAAGRLEEAAAALGRDYAVAGRVIPGDARGRGLGFRTLNLQPESDRKLLPPDGVYAVDVRTPRGRFGGMMNLGGRPTFGDERRMLEAHLFDADGDFYGDLVQVAFVRRLRDTMRFDGPDALKRQLADDERAARLALTPIAGPDNLNGSTPAPPSTP